MVLLRILFQLCFGPIIGALLTWWIWDNAWIGGIIGSGIVIYICIKHGGIGWIFDDDSGSSRSMTHNLRSSTIAEYPDSRDTQFPAAVQTSLYNAEYYKQEYENYRQKAEEALQYAETNQSYADHEANQASLYDDPSHLDKEREYRSWATQYANEARSYFDKAEYYRRMAEDAYNQAQAYMS